MRLRLISNQDSITCNIIIVFKAYEVSFNQNLVAGGSLKVIANVIYFRTFTHELL
jgi:hypothetical protein